MGRTNRIVLVTGTGTEVGKTHVAAALLAAWGLRERVVGYKPIETGARREPGQVGADARRLARASTFHVEHSVFHQTFEPPISPHLAARREAARIDVRRIAEQARALAREADGVVVELAGGLFTPLGPRLFNADLLRNIKPGKVVLVAPDRLGVLHDIGAALGAAAHAGVVVTGVVLSAPRVADASTGTNAGEIEGAIGARLLASFPRARLTASATRQAARVLLNAIQPV